MKKFLATILAIIMIASVLPLTASAATTSGKCGSNVTWTYDENTATLNITGTGAISDFTREGKAPWDYYRGIIKKVIISNGITRIGDRAFKFFSSLEDVEFPNTLTTIGEEAFRQSGIVSLELPDTVTEIGYMSFRECRSLENFNTGDGLKEIPGLAFFQCSKLQNLVIGKSVKTIGSEAFNMCESLKTLTLGNNVESVYLYAIASCTSLQKIIVPKSLKSFGKTLSISKLKEVYYLGTEENWNKIAGVEQFSSVKKTFNAHKHVACSSWEILVAGSCTEGKKQVKHLKCRVCDAEMDLKVLKITHSYGKYKFNNDATCSANGTKTAVCKYCSAKKTVTAKNTKLSHKLKLNQYKAATYSTEGNKCYYYCSLCKNCFSNAKGTKKISKSSTVISRLGLPFTDVAKGSWYYDSVCYCADNGYIKGINAVTFSPDSALTREQFVQILFNFAGGKASDWKGKVGYSDVPSGQWYSPAIKWAKENEVTHGMGVDYFGLGIKITREQFAYLLMNYASYLGRNVSARGSISKFKDKDKISFWAVEPIKWAVGEKLIFGTTSDTLSPKRVANRATASMLFMNFDKYLKK